VEDILTRDDLAAAAAGVPGIEHFMRPRSIAIIGMSSKPGTPSQTVLLNLLAAEFPGPIHLVGRSGGTIEGLPVVGSIDELPMGVDLAVLIPPANAVRDAVERCIARGVRSAVCFSSGFAETGDAGRAEQEAIGRIAREGGLPLIGPNCVGYFNYVDAFAMMLVPTGKLPAYRADAGPAVAVVAQSGGIGHHLGHTLESHGVPVSYTITTGNEAYLGVADMIGFLLDDPHTGAIICYVEQIRRPADMLAVAAAAKTKKKPVLMLHPGRSAKGRAAAASHTGALTGDYAVMQTIIDDSGILLVETLEELIDIAQILIRYPDHDGGGLGIVTTSGALCGIAQDYCDARGLDVPPMSPAQADALRPQIPEFTPPRNPLDLGTLPAWQPHLMRLGVETMLADPAIGSVMVSNPYVGPPISTMWAKAVSEFTAPKPIIYVVHDEDVPLPEEAAAILRGNHMVVMRSPERAIRALSTLTAHARRQRARSDSTAHRPFAGLPALGRGVQPEWLGKELLKAIGVPVPAGALARTPDEAARIAARIGYPVVLKAQSADLAHKSEAGGVILNIADEAALRQQWNTLHANVARARPGLVLDGVLIETMGERGLELVVGARRDPMWGPVLLIGLGGVWIEALGDVRLLPVAAGKDRIIAELGKLKAAKLLGGFRGSPPVDVGAVADIAGAIGRLMATRPDIVEIDVNPVVALADGQGALALDALVITR
jgi:acyl-CoA synthetase (NDP forming)